jgi:hypothetical protein
MELAIEMQTTDSYPDLFELWTLINTIEAVADNDAFELHSFDSYRKRDIDFLRFRDVHPSGRVRGATIDRVGFGLAPSFTVTTLCTRTSIWYDKYVGVSLDGCYWPRPDIVIRSGTYEILKSVSFETHARGNDYSGGYEIRRGRNYSETVKGWRSLSDLVRDIPELRDHSAELASNFKVTKELSIVSNEIGEPQAVAGRPPEAFPKDGGIYAQGQVQGDDGVIFWARRMSFLRPDIIIECKSGLLTPHAIDQLAMYRRCFSSTPLIVATTRLPGSNLLSRLKNMGITCIPPPATLTEDYDKTLKTVIEEARENQ